MNFEWYQLLEFAEAANKKAADFPNQEAVYRTVTSRAYYAVYCETRNFVDKKHGEKFTVSPHQELQNFLITYNHQLRNKLGRNLKKLHQYRLQADYEDKLNELPVNLASKALTLAKQIIEVDLPAITGKK